MALILDFSRCFGLRLGGLVLGGLEGKKNAKKSSESGMEMGSCDSVLVLGFITSTKVEENSVRAGTCTWGFFFFFSKI